MGIRIRKYQKKKCFCNSKIMIIYIERLKIRQEIFWSIASHIMNFTDMAKSTPLNTDILVERNCHDLQNTCNSPLLSMTQSLGMSLQYFS